MFQSLKRSKHKFHVQRLFFPKNRAVYEITYKNMVDADKHQMAKY